MDDAGDASIDTPRCVAVNASIVVREDEHWRREGLRALKSSKLEVLA